MRGDIGASLATKIVDDLDDEALLSEPAGKPA
jgi:hypothetical protein